MEARLHSSLVDFEVSERSVYHRDPVLFTLELTTLRTMPWPAEQILLSVGDANRAVGAAVETRDSVLLVNGLPPEAALTAVEGLASVRKNLSGVRGTPETATAFTQAWQAVTGARATELSRDVLYRLGELRAPSGVAGSWRPARPGDAETVVHWLDAFFVEAFGEPSNVEASRTMLASIADAGDHVLLWAVDGEPVSMARVRPAVVGTSRIGPVYTPPEQRGRGYAAAVTTAAAQFALRAGASEVVLFADTDNPVSNRVYRRIGFEAVAADVRCTFAGS